MTKIIEPTTTLKSLSLKATPKRLAIIDILTRESRTLTPDEVHKQLRERFVSIGLPTVYRNLEVLAIGGVVTKVVLPDRKLYYYRCMNREHHHHFVCEQCRKVEDIPGCHAGKLARSVERTTKGIVLGHLVQLTGLCADCVKSSGRTERKQAH